MYLGIALRTERQRVKSLQQAVQALTRAELFTPHIRRVTERHCDCGGSPKGEGGCVACQIYHELNEELSRTSITCTLDAAPDVEPEPSDRLPGNTGKKDA